MVQYASVSFIRSHLDPQITNMQARCRRMYLSFVVFAFVISGQHIAMAADQVYWCEASAIRRSNLDGTNIETVVAVGVAEVTVDVVGGKVYWLGSASIARSNLDGSGTQVIVSGLESQGGELGFALDLSAHKVYWIESSRIGRANLDGSVVETVLTVEVENPTAIAVDEQHSKIYWTWNEQDTAIGAIERCNIDGTDREDVTPSLFGGYPWALALDLQANMMYWTDREHPSGRDVVRRAGLNGTGAETIIATDSFAFALFGIAVDSRNGRVWWSEPILHQIRHANLEGFEASLFPVEVDSPAGIWVALDPVFGDIFPSNGNGLIDVDDILCILGGFINPVQFPEADIFPCNGNGVIDVDDISAVLNAFIGFPACVWSNGMWVPN